MENTNVESDEWWELAKMQFKEKMTKNLATHKKDDDRTFVCVYESLFKLYVQESI
jgi:hypothetical protein